MKYTIIFVLSIIACLLTLLIERVAGIEWDYHVDVFTYVTDNQSIVSQGIQALPNNFYYFITYALGSSVSLLIALNIVFYGLTNIVIAKVFYQFANRVATQAKLTHFYLLLLLIAPYRLHLAVQGLKDTLIIFALFAVASSINRKSLFSISWIFLILLRIYSLLYALLFIRGRNLLVMSILMLVLILSFDYSILDFLYERNAAGMHGREFDTIPSFSDYGLLGTLIRMPVWPFLLLSGVFVVISPTVWFLPIAFEMIFSRIVSKKVFGQWGSPLSLVICLAVIAAAVDSYTAYIRYVYPAVLIMPVIIMQRYNTRKN